MSGSGSGKIVFDMFSEERIELMREVNRHPPLVEILNRVPDATWEERLAMIAAYGMIMVDGYYSQEELERLYEILITKLRDMRAVALHMGGATPFANASTVQQATPDTGAPDLGIKEVAEEETIDDTKPDEGEIIH